MQSIFDLHTAQSFIDRINKLTPQTQPEWGKMTVNQMLAHCQKPIDIASGRLIPKISPVVKFLFGKRAKKQLVNDPQFKKSLPTFSEAIIIGQPAFDEEKQKLILLIQNFQKSGPEGLIKEPHPFFGDMSVSDWNTLQVKHLDHHLRQFGV